MDRDETKQRLRMIASDIHTLAATSYGPTGRAKLIQPNEDAPDVFEVTTVAERILDRLGTSDCPLASVYLHILRSRIRNHSDGGLFTLLLSSKLLLAAIDADGQLRYVPPVLIAEGYQLALEWCAKYLEDPSCPVRFCIDWCDDISVPAVIRGIIGSKAVAIYAPSAQDQLSHLTPLLTEAFVSVVPFLMQNPGESIPIRFQRESAYSTSLSESRVLKNSVLLLARQHASRGLQLVPLFDVRVLIFSVSLDPTLELTHDDEPHRVHVRSSQERDRDECLSSLGDTIAATGVRLVISQKLIPDFLQDYLQKRGILCIERLGNTHMRAIEFLTGVHAIGDCQTRCISGLTDFSIGKLSCVKLVQINHEDMLLLQNNDLVSSNSRWPVTTLVLSTPNEQAFAELVHVISTCFKRLESLMETPEIVSGAGSTEIHLAAWLRRNSVELVPLCPSPKYDSSTLRQLRSVVENFAEALESIAAVLDHGIHGLSSEVVQSLRAANRETLDTLPETVDYTLHGWNPVLGIPTPVATLHQRYEHDSSSDSENDDTVIGMERFYSPVSAYVVDSFVTKLGGLTAATECVTALLRVAGVIIVR